MVVPNSQGNGWNNAASAITAMEEARKSHHGQQRVVHNPEDPNFASPASGQCPRRGRSMSVASTQPSVETVISKAKRAASTLWTLLHAQVGTAIVIEKERRPFLWSFHFSVLLKLFSRSTAP